MRRNTFGAIMVVLLGIKSSCVKKGTGTDSQENSSSVGHLDCRLLKKVSQILDKSQGIIVSRFCK